MSSTSNYQPVRSQLVEYYVRSSVPGGRVVTELNTQGRKVRTNVYAGGEAQLSSFS